MGGSPEKDKYEILGLLTEKFGKPLSVPPSNGESKFTRKQLDSILNQAMKIGLLVDNPTNQISESYFEDLSISNFPDGYSSNILSNINDIEINKINIKKRFKIFPLDSILSDHESYSKGFDRQININYFSFNKDYSKAVVY